MISPYEGGKFKVTQLYKFGKHNGLDVVGLSTKRLVALADGVIYQSRMVEDKKDLTWQWGNYVTLRTDDGVYVIYAHLSKRLVNKGDRVRAGDVIGVEGNTGYSFGDHCHLEVRTLNNRVTTDVNSIKYTQIPNTEGTYEVKSNAIKIMLDAGHYGKYNHSAAYEPYWESEMTWKLCNLLESELKAYGFEVSATRAEQQKDLPVFDRGRKAAGYDMFISLHSNAVGSEPNERIDHPVVYRLQDDIEKGEPFAQELADMIASLMQTKEKGRTGTRIQSNGNEYYGVLRGAKSVGCPHAFIVEHSFHTATAPAKWLYNENNLAILAREEAKLIAKFYEKEGQEMTDVEKVRFEKLENDVKELQKMLKVYHYWKELPKWAVAPLWALHQAGGFAGVAPDDLGLNQIKMEALVSNAGFLEKKGLLTYPTEAELKRLGLL